MKFFEFNNNYVNFDSAVAQREQQTGNFNVNWTSIFTPIKDQGQCGSCWTFSTAGVVESNYYITKNLTSPISLSEQQIVDCASMAGDGCNGGDPGQALVYAESGLESEASYPYFSGTTENAGTCQFSANKVEVSIKSYNYCMNGSSQPCTLSVWQSMLALGPLSVVVEADSMDFQMYAGGILAFGVCDCANGADHAVIAVGWGVDATTELTYIIVRNSWGTSWGEAGYFRMEYEPSNQDSCYVTGTAYQPTF